MNILIIIEFNNFSENLKKFINKYNKNKFLFLLNSSSEIRLVEFLNKINENINYETINSESSKQEIEKILNIEFKNILSLKNFKEFTFDGHNKKSQMNFIFSDLYEKNQFKSFHNENFIKFLIYNKYLTGKKFDLIYFKNINQFSKSFLTKFYLKKILLFNIKISKIKNLLISFLYFSYFFFRIILFKFIFLFKKITYNKKIIFQSYFPYYNSIKSNYILEDDCLYYKKIARYYSGDNLWILHSIKSTSISFVNYLKYIIKTKSNITFIENEIKLLDYLYLLITYIKVNFKPIKYKSNINDDNFNNLSTYLNYSLEFSLSSKNLIYSYICFYSYKNFFKKIKINSKLIYLFEMQSWENAMNLSKPTNIFSIAYNHTAISRFYTFFFKSEHDLNTDNLKNILPNKIAYNGEYHLKLMKTHYPNLKHKLVESLRFTHLLTAGQDNYYKSKNDILFLFSINKYETKCLINILNDICDDSRFNHFNILLKFHPSLKMPIINNKNNNRISIVKESSYSDNLSSSTYVICGTSSSSIEALFFSCKIIVPDYLSSFFKPPLCDHKKYFKSFKSMDDLHNIIIQNNDDNKNYFSKFARDYWFIDYSKPERLINYINE